MICERAAWRKISVRRTVGTAPDSMTSSRTRPGPTGASWSTSPTSSTCVRGPTAPSSASASRTESIEASSTISMSRPGIGSSGPREKPSPGTYSSRRWIVLASAPVSSPSRRAALPVGAHSRTDRFWSRSRSTSARIVCVLPVPGRPVRIDSRCSSAFVTASHWASVGTNAPLTGRSWPSPSRRRSAGGDSASSRTLRARRRSIAYITGSETRPSSSTSFPDAASVSRRSSASVPSSRHAIRPFVLAI